MATKKKTQTKKTNSRKKRIARRSSKIAASENSRRMSAKAKTTRTTKTTKTTKTTAKSRPGKTKAAKSVRPRKAGGKGTTPRETTRVFRSSLPTRAESQSVETVNLDPKGLGLKSGGQSGDLQGLSNVESADSESVGELLEEGNAFEAGVVSGVEDSKERDGKEVRTREVPEDDVPGEYLDEQETFRQRMAQ